MIGAQLIGLCLALLAAELATPRTGIVVEKVVPGYEAAKAGIQAGDILLSWERAPNLPANPAPARGEFRSPFDVLEVFIAQAPRARTLTLVLLRDGKRVSAPILQYPWRLETRPAFTGTWLEIYGQGTSLIEKGELEKGADAWRSLALELSEANQRVDAAWLWLRLGTTQAAAKQVDAAVDSFERALVEAQAAGRPDIEAQLRGLEGEMLRSANRLEDAKTAMRRALATRERSDPDSLAVAYCLHELATVMPDALGSEYEAINRRALRIREKLAPASRNEANSLTNLAAAIDELGDARTGVELQLRALAIHRNLEPAGPSVARTLSTLCGHELGRGNIAAAEEYCARSVDLWRRLGPGELPNLAISLHNSAGVARHRGDLDRAEGLFLEARATRERTQPVSRGMAWNVYELAVIELRRGNLDKAEELFGRSEEIQKVTAAPDSPYRAQTAARLAEIAYLRGDLVRAEELLRQAVAFYDALTPDGPGAADMRDDLGRVLAERGAVSEAEVQLRRALAGRQKFAPASHYTAESRHSLGRLLWRTGRLAEAEAELRRSIDDLEAQQAKLGGSEESRSAFAARFADYYKDYLRLLIEMRRGEDAFLILERFRAGAFLKTLAQRDLAVPEEIPAGLDRERQAANAEYERTQGRIRTLRPQAQAKEIDQALARLRELRRQQAGIAERISKASPRYAALRYPRPLDLAGARAALDPGTLLLSYATGPARSYLFVVSGDPKRGIPLSVFTLPIGENALRESVEAFRRLIKWNKTPEEFLARGQSLYDALLKPAEALIARSDRLLILPDGPLHALPWAALVRSAKTGPPRPLAEWKPIHTAISATVHMELKKSRADAPRDSALLVAAFGDPKYPTLPERKSAITRGEGEAEAEAAGPSDEIEEIEDPQLRSVARGGFRFEPLPASRKEVEEIASLYAPRSAAYLGAEATEEKARAIGRNVPLIHFACHAYVNELFPLDSALVFTIPDKPREGQDNGLLQAWEIFEKVRIDADLVTLSACESGLGKEMGGEGLIGLTRAFQYAGARSVLASLWKVEDQSTAELMKRFYRYLKAGKTKDEALRLAQTDLMRSPDYSQPKDWAAFQLDGDWK